MVCPQPWAMGHGHRHGHGHGYRHEHGHGHAKHQTLGVCALWKQAPAPAPVPLPVPLPLPLPRQGDYQRQERALRFQFSSFIERQAPPTLHPRRYHRDARFDVNHWRKRNNCFDVRMQLSIAFAFAFAWYFFLASFQCLWAVWESCYRRCCRIGCGMWVFLGHIAFCTSMLGCRLG